MSYENQILERMETLEDRLQKMHSEYSDRSDDMARRFNRAFNQAQEDTKARYDALKELTEQMKIGQAMQVLKEGISKGEFDSDPKKSSEMRDLYAQLKARVINDAKEIVKSDVQRGSEFDDILDNQSSLNGFEFK